MKSEEAFGSSYQQGAYFCLSDSKDIKYFSFYIDASLITRFVIIDEWSSISLQGPITNGDS
jgi:hypothetical protein